MNIGKLLISNIIDTWTMTKRNLYRYIRLPQLIFFSSIQPIMFLVLFNFVFGGAISGAGIPGGKYINFLLPGILIQIVMFGGMQTGIGLAVDMSSGVVDRFRSLPMSRIAVLAGRTLSDTLRNVVVAGIIIGVGSLLGFRFQNGFWAAISMVALILAFGFAFSWVMAYIGMTVKDTETAQVAGFPLIFPLIFASAAFVPIQTMPHWLQVFAANQPVTFAVEAARGLALGIPDHGAIWKLLLWTFGLLAVFVPLSVYRYKSRV
jgi:ABC-2 type transport system permease protein/oleandomycin transport system permease protein